MAQILVVYYSRSGSTQRVARHLADALDADLERIEDVVPRAGLRGYLSSALEAAAKGMPTIRTSRDPGDYARVVLGTPVWAETIASPVRAYIALHRGRLRHAAFFAVMGGLRGERTLREMQVACGAFDAPTLLLTEADVRGDRHRAACASFVPRLAVDGAARAALA